MVGVIEWILLHSRRNSGGGWITCFDKAKLSGVIRGVGVTDIGDIHHNEMLLSEAYKMGKEFRI